MSKWNKKLCLCCTQLGVYGSPVDCAGAMHPPARKDYVSVTFGEQSGGKYNNSKQLRRRSCWRVRTTSSRLYWVPYLTCTSLTQVSIKRYLLKVLLCTFQRLGVSGLLCNLGPVKPFETGTLIKGFTNNTTRLHHCPTFLIHDSCIADICLHMLNHSIYPWKYTKVACLHK